MSHSAGLAAPHSARLAAPLRLTLDRLPARLVSGHILVITARTAKGARVAGRLMVLASGRSPHATPPFALTISGQADAHGRFVTRVWVRYTPRSPVQALLSLQAWSGSLHGHAATARVIIQALPVAVRDSGFSDRYGDMLRVRVHTVAHAHVDVLVQALTTGKSVSGRGAHMHARRRIVVLYQAVLRGNADGHGQFTGSTRVTYTPNEPVRGSVRVTVHVGGLAAAADPVRITFLP